MRLEFGKLSEDECLLCGATGRLTGEHKIKASLLKDEFGNRPMRMTGKDTPKILQSPRSKHAHFRAKICLECKSSRTQKADKAFDRLHQRLKKLRLEGKQITNIGDLPNYELTPQDNTEPFRYLAKILSCYLAEVGGLRSRSISAFALGLTDKNPILLKICKDEQYETKLHQMETKGFAEHGGLKVRFDDKKKWVQSLESSLAVGGIRYEFWVQLGWILKWELCLRHREFVRKGLLNLAQD